MAAGANAAVALSDADRTALGAADVVLAQLEVPQRLVADAAAARHHGALSSTPHRPHRSAPS